MMSQGYANSALQFNFFVDNREKSFTTGKPYYKCRGCFFREKRKVAFSRLILRHRNLKKD